MNACLIHVQLMQTVKTLMEVLLVLVKMVILELELFAKVIQINALSSSFKSKFINQHYSFLIKYHCFY